MCVLHLTHAGRALGTKAVEAREKDNQLGTLLLVTKQKLAAAEEKRPGQSVTKATSWGSIVQAVSGEELVRETEATATSASSQMPCPWWRLKKKTS